MQTPRNFCVGAAFTLNGETKDMFGVVQIEYNRMGEGRLVLPLTLRDDHVAFAGLEWMAAENRKIVGDNGFIKDKLTILGLEPDNYAWFDIFHSTNILDAPMSLVINRRTSFTEVWREWSARNDAETSARYVASAAGFVDGIMHVIPHIYIYPRDMKELILPQGGVLFQHGDEQGAE
jgi:hypothetical protein